MVHNVLVRAAAQRALERVGLGPVSSRVGGRVIERGLADFVSVRRLASGRRRVEASVAGQNVGVTLPPRADEIGDLPL